MQAPPLEDTTSESVIDWLANTKESWLLILDNCDDYRIDFSQFMPSRGCVIITTRLKECQKYGAWENIDELGSGDATQLLIRASGCENDDQNALELLARSVVSVLGQHALALVHAGAYIRKGLCSLSEYVRYFRDEQDRLMKFKPDQQASRYGSIYTTFEVSATALATSDRHASHLALGLLNILAFLNREAIEEEIFVKAFDECHSLEGYLGSSWEENEVQWSECGADPSTRHGLFVENHDAPEKSHSSEGATYVLCSWRGGHSTSAEKEKAKFEAIRARPTVQSMIEASATSQASIDTVPERKLVPETSHDTTLGDCFDQSDVDHPSKHPVIDAARSITRNDSRDETQGPGDSDSEEKDRVNEDDQGYKLYKHIKDDKSNSEIDHLDIWHCNKVRSSGLVDHHGVERLRAACVCLAELSLINFVNNTISMHPLVHQWARNRLDETAQQHAWEQAVSVVALASANIECNPCNLRLVPHIDVCARDLVGEKGQAWMSLNIVRAFYSLARLYHEDRRHEASLRIYETLSVSYQIPPYTWSHKSTVLLRAKARCFQGLARYEDMHSCATQVLQTTARWFEPDSREAYQAQVLLADTYHLTGNFQDKVDLYESLYKRNSQTSMFSDRDMSKFLTGLIEAHKSLGNHERAVEVSIEKLRVSQRAFPLHHHTLLDCMISLADLYITVGAPDKAVTLLEHEADVMLKQTSQDHRSIDLMSTLARAYDKLGRYERASAVLEKVHSYYIRTPSSAHDHARVWAVDLLARALSRAP